MININEQACNGCGLCVTVCNDNCLHLEEGKVVENQSPVFGCYACGHCMAICPSGAIEITGRELTPQDTYDLPALGSKLHYEHLLTLLQGRRSIRKFKDTPVDNEGIEKILEAARTAPMGLPPSDVNVLVINGKEKLRAFTEDFSKYLKGLKFMTSRLFLTVMRPFWGRENDEMFKAFISPLFKAYTVEMDKGKNYITYDAPVAMYFYGSPYSDPADSIIAATYAMIAAESLGLGSCMLGGIHPFIQNGRKAKKFRERHGIKCKSKEGLFLVFGYPDIRFKKGIRRTFASVKEIF